MIRRAAFAAALGLLAVAPAAASQHGVFIMLPAAIEWHSSSDLPPGAKLAVLEGDPTKPGPYTARISCNAGMVSPMHFHPNAEYITVLSGTMKIASGPIANAATITLPAGSYVEIPAGVHHFVKCQTASIVQVSGMGPMTMTVVK